jgi:signal transduction histidine kinase
MQDDRLRIRDIRNTSTFRLTLLFGVVFAVGVAALIGLIYVLSARELTLRSDHVLHMEAAMLRAAPVGALPNRINAEIARSASGLNYFELQSSQGDHLAGNIRMPMGITLNQPIEIDAGHGLAEPIRLLAMRVAPRETLLVGRDISPVRDLRQRVLTILVLSGLATAVAVLASGIALSLAPLRRVRDLQRASRTIAAGDLEVRMPLAGRGDELDLFAGTVNAMVDEVGRVVAQVKGVTDAVAHDLRTPLTRVRSQLYRARQSIELGTVASTMIDAAAMDLGVVLERFAALLRISELETGRRRAGFGPIDLDRLIATVHELYDPLAEERGIGLRLNRTAPVFTIGDEKLLFEAVSNLVDNAIKFTAVGGHVELSVVTAAEGPAIEVRDNGPGIPEDERRAVLRRFHRGTDSAEIPGAGLGLSVVSAIMHLHDFSLDFSDGNPGLIARIQCRNGAALGSPR